MGEGILMYGTRAARSDADYYKESKRLRAEVLSMAKMLKDNPKRFSINNGIRMDVEMTKSDLKTIVSKNSRNNKLNAVKNALAKDIPGYLRKAKYIGTRTVKEGKHTETAFFAYYSRSLGARTILCMRKMNDGGVFKPYAIIDERTFKGGK